MTVFTAINQWPSVLSVGSTPPSLPPELTCRESLVLQKDDVWAMATQKDQRFEASGASVGNSSCFQKTLAFLL